MADPDPYALAAKVADSLRVTDVQQRAQLENTLTISLMRDPGLSQALAATVHTPLPGSADLPGRAQLALTRERTRLHVLQQSYLELVARFRSLAAALEHHPSQLQWAVPLLDFARLQSAAPGGGSLEAPGALGPPPATPCTGTSR
jgi:hypothetical protein